MCGRIHHVYSINTMNMSEARLSPSRVLFKIQQQINKFVTCVFNFWSKCFFLQASLNSEHCKLKPESGKGYQLELDISSISFLHHPLFSTEHVIESRLLQMCDKHLCHVKEDFVNALKLKVYIIFYFNLCYLMHIKMLHLFNSLLIFGLLLVV